MKLSFLFIICSFSISISIKAQMVFTTIDAFFQYANTKNIALQSGNIKLDQAKKAKLAAIMSIPDITGNVSFSYTNNTRLPVNLFPAEIFGGQPGTYQEVETGVQYNTYANENVDVKLFNPKGWVNVQLYKLNMESNTVDNKVTLKQLHENIAATYFNIVMLQEQLIAAKQNKAAADTLLRITKDKYAAGLIRQQDVNDASVNAITSKENVQQLQYLIQQQYLALKIICDIPEQELFSIAQTMDDFAFNGSPVIENNTIQQESSLVKEKIAKANYQQQKYAFYPTVSFFQSVTTQQFNTQRKLFDPAVNWIPSSYIGLRINIPIPSSGTISQLNKAKYDYLLATKNTEQQKLKAVLDAKQLSVDHEKAKSQLISNKEVYALRKDTYEKNLHLYNEGLMALEQTLNSFNAMVTSNYNWVAAQVTVLTTLSKININNTIK